LSVTYRRYKKRSRKLSAKQLCGIAGGVVVVVSLLAVYSFNQPNSAHVGFSAAVIDQLSSMQGFTNGTFVRAANDTLITAGYQVTYYKGSDVTVGFYRALPTMGYKILVFRVHSALRLNSSGTGVGPPLDFFTSELYSNTTYAAYQIDNWLDIAVYNGTGNKNEYFGILDGFVTGAMVGSFQNATIILMGCNGLDTHGQGYSEAMLRALVDRGAKVIIGWNASVSVSHTDVATEDLLGHLLVENETVKDAITATNNEVGPDPSAYKNKLLYYPSKSAPFNCTIDVGNYTIPHGSPKSATTQTTNDYIPSSANAPVLAAPFLLSIGGHRTFRTIRKKSSFTNRALKQ
jgi:hypothetical protein